MIIRLISVSRSEHMFDDRRDRVRSDTRIIRCTTIRDAIVVHRDNVLRPRRAENLLLSRLATIDHHEERLPASTRRPVRQVIAIDREVRRRTTQRRRELRRLSSTLITPSH